MGIAKTIELSEKNLGRLAGIRLRKFRDMQGLPMPEVSMTANQRELFESLTQIRIPWQLFEHISQGKDGKEMDKYLAAYYAALRFNEDRNWRFSFNLLRVMHEEYLARDLKHCPEEMGGRSAELMLITARAWTTIHANYLMNHMERDLVPDEFLCGLVTTDIQSIRGVAALEIAGTISDLPIIEILLTQCGDTSMETRCREAYRKIIVREALAHAFGNSSADEIKEFGIDLNLHSMAQIIARLEYAFYLYGIGDFLVQVSQTYGPISLRKMQVRPDSQLGRLCRDGLDGKIEVCSILGRHLQMEAPVVNFLVVNGMGDKTGDWGDMTIELTSKGKGFFRFLMQKIFGVEQIPMELPAPVMTMLEAPKTIEA